MQVLRILAFASLSALDVADLQGVIADLSEELEGADDWLNQDLVVYVTNQTEPDGSLHRIVAPRSPEIRPGDTIAATGWTATRSDSTGRATVHAAHAVASARM